MKVLYAAFRHDPRNPDAGSGVDHNFYKALIEEGADVRIVGPFPGPFPWYEKAVRILYERVTGARYIPWDLTSSWRASIALNRAERTWQPDAVFTIFPPTLVWYRGKAPCVLNMDVTSPGKRAAGVAGYGQFGDAALAMLRWMEQRAVRRATACLTFSEACRRDLIGQYGARAEAVTVLPMPAALPEEVVPATLSPGEIRNGKALGDAPLRLLLVGRDFHRKGVDVAMETVRLLNAQGVAAELTVCATQGPPAPHVRYVGPFRKRVPEELAAYAALYREAHLLLHPARFEAAGIVPGEAAAFGTPTLTHAAGGLATTVKDGESGVVLPKDSPPEAYAAVIRDLIEAPEAYYALCERARARYERELNWKAARKQVIQCLESVMQQAG